MIAYGFFSDTRRQKWSLAGLREYFGSKVAGKKNTLATKIGFLEIALNIYIKKSAYGGRI